MANTKSALQRFAKRIERRMVMAKGPAAMENLVCRLLTGHDDKVASVMVSKWVEWTFGKTPETLKVTGHIEHEHFDASRLSDQQLAEAERLVESAHAGSNPE